MKRVVLAVILLFCVGCMPNRAFVTAVDGHTKLILPEYKAYLDADTTLDASSKRIRTDSADTLQALIDTAKAVQP